MMRAAALLGTALLLALGCSSASPGSCPEGQIWCAGCTPGTGACYAGGCPGAACPQLDGATTGNCGAVATLEACDARADCHPVFVDPRNCACAALGCCAQFERCGDGARASCNGQASCDIVMPYCEGSYVVAYIGSCYEGCVRAADCAP
jgi:hypothetical protein